jgi:hypothetical protein
MELYKSKKGDIPVTILVIEVIAVCALALVTFMVSSFSVEQKFYGIASMQEINVLIEDYNFYKNAGVSEEKIEEVFDVQEDGNGKYFEVLISSSDVGFFSPLRGEITNFFIPEDFLFSVRYYLPEN